MKPAHEFNVVSLRECPDPTSAAKCDGPKHAAAYWRKNIATNPAFNPEVEQAVVLMLNARKRVKGHVVIGLGTVDSCVIHPREVFRAAIIASAQAVIIMHNHPSGDPTPSQADIEVTRDLVRASQILKLELLDHVIIGQPKHASLRELGYFHKS
jgi:DNA repair protein RadC